MGGTCKMVCGLLTAVAGLVLLLYGLGMMTNAMMVHMVAGLCLLLTGVAGLVHCMKMCPMCATMCEDKGKKG